MSYGPWMRKLISIRKKQIKRFAQEDAESWALEAVSSVEEAASADNHSFDVERLAKEIVDRIPREYQ